jgi:hypothetical protein
MAACCCCARAACCCAANELKPGCWNAEKGLPSTGTCVALVDAAGMPLVLTAGPSVVAGAPATVAARIGSNDTA